MTEEWANFRASEAIDEAYERGRADERRLTPFIHGEEGAKEDYTLCSACVDGLEKDVRESQADGLDEAADFIAAYAGKRFGSSWAFTLRQLAKEKRKR